jgi:23S rRNA G2445 N2-methylase RlmL
MKYMVITTRGFEDIIEQDLNTKLSDLQIIEKSYRKIIFSYEGSIKNILEIRSIEDAFLFIAKLDSIGHTRNDLPDLIKKISGLDFSIAKESLQKIRPESISQFSISSSSVGKRNYSYIEVKDGLSKILAAKLDLTYENELHQQFDIRVFLEHESAYIGVRLGNTPLHRRPYKTSTTKATLRADIAYCMALLSEISHKDTVLDPMCGSGTILIESSIFEPKMLIGGDINPDALEATKANVNSFDTSLDIQLKLWDSTSLPLQDNSVNKIICNLPFGKQIEVEDIDQFYQEVFQEFIRVTKSNGKIVILTSYTKTIELIHTCPEIHIKQTFETNLNGEVAQLIVLNILK